MVYLCLCGNSHSKPLMPFYQGLSLPPIHVLSVNQLMTITSLVLLEKIYNKLLWLIVHLNG